MGEVAVCSGAMKRRSKQQAQQQPQVRPSCEEMLVCSMESVTSVTADSLGQGSTRIQTKLTRQGRDPHRTTAPGFGVVVFGIRGRCMPSTQHTMSSEKHLGDRTAVAYGVEGV